MKRAELRERALYWAGGTAFFLFAFLISAYHTFPYDRLRQRLEGMVNADADAGGADALRLHIGELSPSWLTGVELHNVDLERGTEDSPNYAKLHLDSATVRAALSALFGKISGSATAHVGSGKIEANYADTGTSQQIDAELDGVDLLKLGAGGWAGVPLSGTAGGTVNVTLEQDPTKSVGDLALKAVDFHIGDGKHKIKVPGLSGGITLEEIDAGTLDLAINLHDGQGDVERFATKNGHDLAADGSGSLRLANPLGRTRLDVLIELKFTDSFKNRNDRTKALFSLLQVNPELRRAVADDGTIGVHLGGTVQALRATPASGTRVGGRPARPKKGDKAKAAATTP